MQENIDHIIRRTRRYWYEDGFAEIAIGLLFSIVGLGLYLQKLATGDPIWLMVVIVGLMIFIFSSSLLVKWLVTLLKQRVTYPRTGYVEYDPERERQSRFPVIAFALVLALMGLLIPDQFSSMGIVVGLLMGMIMAYLAYRSAIPRFMVGAGVAVILGLLTTYLALDDIVGTALVFGGVGLALLIGGTLALIGYLHQTQPPKEDV